jgi:hypothetical protein
MKNTFATQVFLNNGKYDALCYYDEVKQWHHKRGLYPPLRDIKEIKKAEKPSV